MKRYGFLVAALLLVSGASIARAENKPPVIPAKKTFLVAAPGGGQVRCATVKGAKVYVVKAPKGFLPGARAIANLKALFRGAPAAKKKSLKAKLATLKHDVTEGNSVCSGNGSNPGGTNPGGTNPGGSASFEKITRPLTRRDVRLLVDKAGFGLGADEERLVEIGTTQGVDALVDEFMKTRDEPAGLLDRVSDRLDQQLGSTTTQSPPGQRAAILDLWLHTKNPYAERMAMSLLSIWTVSGEVIEDETFRSAFWDYYTRLRNYSHAETDIPAMAVEITEDPLMLLFLNNNQNVKDAPNENYARELMELFTVGPVGLDGDANYTETKLDGSGDILAAARMLTGWTVKLDYVQKKLLAQFDPNRHQTGSFTMFAGKPWQFSGQTDADLVKGIFANHPAVRTYYATELLKLYLTPNPPRALVEAFGAALAANNYKLRPSMKALFTSVAFYDSAYEHTIPIDPFLMAARTTRVLGMNQAVNINQLQYQTTQMGYSPNLPPSVFWYSQNGWNSSSVLLEKANLISQIIGDSSAQTSGGWSPQKVLPVGAATLDQVIDFARDKAGIESITDAQRQAIVSYLSKRLEYNGQYSNFNYDNTNTTHQRDKGLGVYFLLMMSPYFQLL